MNANKTTSALFPDFGLGQSQSTITPAVKSSSLDKIKIRGGHQLNGTIPISGAKNCALKLMCASILTSETMYFENSPNSLRDMHSQVELLEFLGCAIKVENDLLGINASTITTQTAPYDIVRKMRGSILVLGPLLARFGQAKVSLPGGCAIGTRPVDMHIKALEELGAEIKLEDGYIPVSYTHLTLPTIYSV